MKIHSKQLPTNGATKGTKLNRRALLRAAAIAAVATTGVASPRIARAASDELVILGWEPYLTDTVLAAFKKEYGVDIKRVPAATDQEMYTKVRAGGGSAFDLIYADSGFCPLYLRAKIIEPFLAEEVDASKNIYSVFLQNTIFPHVLEPGKVLLFPHAWAPFSMIWNTTLFTAPEPYSWTALWDPKIPEGKVLLSAGNGDDFLALGGLANGLSATEVYAMTEPQLAAAEQRMKELKKFQLVLGADTEFRARIRDGRAWIGLAAQIGSAALANQESGAEVAKAVVPKEGTLGWIDGPQLVAGAKNRDNAFKFMNFIGSSEAYWTHVFDSTGNTPCCRTQVERMIAEGGKRADLIKIIQADHPELAEKLIMQRPPSDPKQYAAAWDRVQATLK